jgi:hypothetical protein
MSLQSSLFDIEPTYSPRTRWMKKYGVSFDRRVKGEIKAWGTIEGKLCFGVGPTEDDALVALAQDNGVETWHEVF